MFIRLLYQFSHVLARHRSGRCGWIPRNLSVNRPDTHLYLSGPHPRGPGVRNRKIGRSGGQVLPALQPQCHGIIETDNNNNKKRHERAVYVFMVMFACGFLGGKFFVFVLSM